MAIEVLRWLHVIGATVLLGTGAGIAFFMVMAHRTRDPVLVAHVAATVVVADAVFTATAGVAQPVTGVLLARELGWSLAEPWIVLSLGLLKEEDQQAELGKMAGGARTMGFRS